MKTIAVIDVETTGLNPYRHDRIVEIAVVLVDPQEGIVSKIDSLVNPERDVGPSSIHGLTATDIISAPRFIDIASHLTDILRPTIALAGHNLRFDISFLRAEYERMGIELPLCARLDTMAIAGGGTLRACCSEHGIAFDGQAHAALNDAQATAKLLLRLLSQSPDILRTLDDVQPPVWPSVLSSTKTLMPRSSLPQIRNAAPNYIQRLATSLSSSTTQTEVSGAERDYRALLWNVLEDGRIEESEGDALVETATIWGLSFETIQVIHRDYLVQLAREAWADRQLTDAERTEIRMAARLLGYSALDEQQIQDLIKSTEKNDVANCETSAKSEDWHGCTVCFTGECSCSIGDSLITRDKAEQMATAKGLLVQNSVTKRLDILVVADPNTQSGKARKAQAYGIRIIHEPRFWRQLGVDVD